MYDDLLDARAAVEWGKAQLPALRQRIIAWQDMSVDPVVVDLNPQVGKKVAVVQAKTSLPLIINAEVGAIIGSIRCSLNLLCAALALRRGDVPGHETHFPVFRSFQDMIDPIAGLEGKKWLGIAEARVIKSFEPHDGGNRLLWALHQLDIVRKHRRLVEIATVPRIERSSLGGGSRPEQQPASSKWGQHVSKRDTHPSLAVVFTELGLNIYREPVVELLHQFACLAAAIIECFDAPLDR